MIFRFKLYTIKNNKGPVRGICKLAPNNVNTMAVGALVAHNIGFDKVMARLVADPQLVLLIYSLKFL
jgi:predicted dinucleotide-utilizing enzyme